MPAISVFYGITIFMYYEDNHRHGSKFTSKSSIKTGCDHWPVRRS